MNRPVMLGETVRFRNCSAIYTVVERDGKLYLKKKNSTSIFPLPHHSRLELLPTIPEKVSEKTLRLAKGYRAGNSESIFDMSGFDALKAAEIRENFKEIAERTPMAEGLEDLMWYAEEDVRRTFQGIKPNIQGGRDMSIMINKTVAKVTNNLEEAELITRYFNQEYNENSFRDELFLKQNYKEVLKEAKAREAKRLAALGGI